MTPKFNPYFTDGLHPSQPEFHRITRPRLITSEVEEDTFTADLDLIWEGDWNDKATTFKTGFKILDREKFVDDTDTRFPYQGYATFADAGMGIKFKEANRGLDYGIADPGHQIWIIDPNAVLAHREANPNDYVFDEPSSTSNSIEDDYNMTEEVFAYYAMASIEITPDIILTGGARVERTDVTVSAFSFVDTVETYHPPEVSLVHTLPFEQSEALFIADNNQYTNVLPSINLKWTIDANLLLRASVTTNIGRPDYPDSSPISTLEVFEDFYEPGVFYAFNEIGNPDLEPFEGTNYDISLDYYFAEDSGVFSVGGFYKRIENAIYQFEEQLFDFEFAGVVFDEYNSETLNNADPGHISGIEFTLQKDLVNLPEPFDGFGILANMALIDSEVTVPERPGEKLPFFNQADTVYNAQVYYERNGFEARLAYTYQSEAIFDELGGDVEEDLFRDELSSLDAKVSLQLNDNWQIYLTAKNLTDEPLTTFWRGTSRRVRGENPGYEIYGSEFRLGATWTK